MVAAGRSINLLNLRAGEPQDGDVIFARKVVIADGDYQSLAPGVVVDLIGVEHVQGCLSCLQFAMRARRGPGSSGVGIGYDDSWLRFPIAAGETRKAMNVMKHYLATTKRGPSLAMVNPKLTQQICFGIAAVWPSPPFGLLERTDAGLWRCDPLCRLNGRDCGGGALLLAAIVFFRVRVDKR